MKLSKRQLEFLLMNDAALGVGCGMIGDMKVS